MDLSEPRNRGKSRDLRFKQRVFTPSERDEIAGSENPDRELWTLWAAKETAYKVLSKSSPSLSSAPGLFAVTFSPPSPSAPRSEVIRGTVACPFGRVAVRICRTDEYVHCVGAEENADLLESIIGQVIRLVSAKDASPLPDESRLTRDAAVQGLSAHLGLKAEEIEIRRIKKDRGLGPPVVCVRGEKTTIDISLSHDGSFGAFAFVPPQPSSERSSRTSRISGPRSSAF
ncbi:MAG: 4'-phosphopantetheinyl transferase superfamily protein [Deltaproteobacteria bacterium]|nr:4'-phosphopantetheinyl transferase superfamily protein [Deltaproteobacteria bacterium]